MALKPQKALASSVNAITIKITGIRTLTGYWSWIHIAEFMVSRADKFTYMTHTTVICKDIRIQMQLLNEKLIFVVVTASVHMFVSVQVRYPIEITMLPLKPEYLMGPPA